MDYAIISVWDKRGIADFCKKISSKFKFIASGGTYEYLKSNGIAVKKIDEITDFPEILGGRVKTLHPKIHGGILSRRTETDNKQLEELAIKPISLVVSNLYPFTPDKPHEEAIELIDIGGPTLVRAAAKNYEHVTVVVDLDDYEQVANWILSGISLENRLYLARKAFEHVAEYDIRIAHYFQKLQNISLPDTVLITGRKAMDLRYGENPHQSAAYYLIPDDSTGKFFEQLSGKLVSYNNMLDYTVGLRILKEFKEPTAVIIKHTSPCGVANGKTLEEAFDFAFDTDNISAFGSIMAFNRKIELPLAKKLHKMFVDGIIAPDYDEDAFKILKKKKKLMLLKYKPYALQTWEISRVPGGFIVQDADHRELTRDDLIFVSEKKPTEEQLRDLMWAWKIVRNVKSNAAVIATGTRTLGIAAGKSSRIDAVKFAGVKAGERARGAVLASDAFFPYPDSVQHAHELGIAAVIAPGGSIRDQLSIDAANELGIPLVFTKIRSFRH